MSLLQLLGVNDSVGSLTTERKRMSPNDRFSNNNSSHKYLKIPEGLFTPGESESEKDKRTSKKDARMNDKHQRKFSHSHSHSFGLNTA